MNLVLTILMFQNYVNTQKLEEKLQSSPRKYLKILISETFNVTRLRCKEHA